MSSAWFRHKEVKPDRCKLEKKFLFAPVNMSQIGVKPQLDRQPDFANFSVFSDTFPLLMEVVFPSAYPSHYSCFFRSAKNSSFADIRKKHVFTFGADNAGVTSQSARVQKENQKQFLNKLFLLLFEYQVLYLLRMVVTR